MSPFCGFLQTRQALGRVITLIDLSAVCAFFAVIFVFSHSWCSFDYLLAIRSDLQQLVICRIYSSRWLYGFCYKLYHHFTINYSKH